MRGLETLIRLHKRQLDEKRRVLAALEQLRAEMEHKARLLDQEIARERQFADGTPETAIAFTGYFDGARQRRDTLARSIADVGAKIDAAARDVMDAFQEVKRFEVAVELKDRRRKAAAAKVEQDALDEVAITQHRRRAAEGK